MARIQGLAVHAAGAELLPYGYDPGTLGPQEVEITISHCGICHSDIHLISNDWGISQYPFIPGHEIVGTVAAVGQGVRTLQERDGGTREVALQPLGRELRALQAHDAPPADAAARGRAISAAKVQIGQSGRLVGQQAIQLHGGIGMTDEYAAGHYFKRLTTIEHSFGDTDYHLDRFPVFAAEVW